MVATATAYHPPTPLAPESTDAEEGVLGSILINPYALEWVSFLRADDFFMLRHQWIFEAMLTLKNRDETIDYLTLIEELKTQTTPAGGNKLSDIGGAAYITLLIANTPSSVNVVDYAKIVIRRANQRRALAMAEAMIQHARTVSDPLALQKKIEAEYLGWIEDSRRVTQEKGGVRRLYDIIRDDTIRMKEARQNGSRAGIATGLRDLDKHLGNLQPGRLYVYAQDTGGGKSAIGLNIAQAAMQQQKRVLFISLEMPEEEHVQRLIAMKTGVSAERQEAVSSLTEDEYTRAIAARLDMLKSEYTKYMCIDESPAMTLPQIQASIRRATQMMGGLELLIVDHMQLIRVQGVAQDNIALITKMIFEGMKATAKAHHIPVWGMAQFNRRPVFTVEKPPTLHDLWGGAAAEQAADVILIGHRPEMYVKPEDVDKPENGQYKNLLRIYNQKKRGGKSHWMVELTFLPEKTMFTNRAIES